MYLSRLILNPHSRRVQHEAADAYEMHRSVMHAFPDDLAKGAERVLFRLEAEARGGGLTLLVQSRECPDWGWLAEPDAAGYLLPVGVPNPAVKPFEVRAAAGQVLAFRLRANPTAKRTVQDKDEKQKKRVGLVREEGQLDWLARKAGDAGFRLITAQVSQKSTVAGRLRTDGRPPELQFLSVQFDGLLAVTDPARLAAAVAAGIGSGKGLGFGLLSLARPAT